MGYGYWDQPRRKEPSAPNEKAYRRSGLAEWDARWHALSVPARTAFLNEVKGPVRQQSRYGKVASADAQPGIPVAKLDRPVLEELTKAGFVEVLPPVPGARG